MWALQNYGFKVVLSSRFGDIFRGYSGKAGLLAAQEDDDTLAAVVGTFSSTAFVPGRMAGMPVGSFTDIELRLGGGEG